MVLWQIFDFLHTTFSASPFHFHPKPQLPFLHQQFWRLVFLIKKAGNIFKEDVAQHQKVKLCYVPWMHNWQIQHKWNFLFVQTTLIIYCWWLSRLTNVFYNEFMITFLLKDWNKIIHHWSIFKIYKTHWIKTFNLFM